MRRPLAAILAILVLAPFDVLADRGSIPFRPNVKIFEPTQRVMIAWNGVEEIMLLSTDLRASKATKVLEVMPLPAEPKVKKGETETFRRAIRLINSKIAPRSRSRGAHAFGPGGEAVKRPAGEVTFHERIGAHDISVTRVNDSAGFVKWVEAYLKKAGAENPTVPPPLKEVIGEYLADGFRWFVFDVVELGTSTKTNDAIQYRFKSDCVYYPMRITRTESGSTTVEMLVLTPKLLRNFPGIPVRQVELPHKPVDISARELASLDKDMSALLGRPPTIMLRIWRIRGKLDSFKHDLVAR